MNSLFTGETGGRPFRVRWRGYDRVQVDEFLRVMASDRQRLEARLAELEAPGTRSAADSLRRSDSLAALRVAIANHLHTSVGALRKATDLLSATASASVEPRGRAPPVSRPAALPVAPQAAGVDLDVAPVSSRGRRPLPALALGVGLAASLLLFYMREPSASEIPAPPVAIGATQPAAEPVATPVATPVTEPVRVAEGSDDLVLTLTALQPCWIRAGIDGDDPFERLLDPGTTITLRALDEVVLRVGDAAALSLLINNRSARPLGAVGQVVTVRVTPANYATLLTDNTDLVTNRPAVRSQG
jgi:hypothetical protein